MAEIQEQGYLFLANVSTIANGSITALLVDGVPPPSPSTSFAATVATFNDTNSPSAVYGELGGGVEAKCPYSPPIYLVERFWLVTVVGTSVAVISVLENLLLFFILISKRHHRNSHCLYLLLLALFDVFMGAAYVPLMSLSLLLDYLESVWLLRSWYAYMTPMITISHIAMTSSSFLILAASFERYCITIRSSRPTSAMQTSSSQDPKSATRHCRWWWCPPPMRSWQVHRHRRLIASAACFLGVITKCTLAAEFDILFNAQCAGTMLEYSLRLSALALDYHYNLLWRLGFRNVITVLLPFFGLLAMNLSIVSALRRTQPPTTTMLLQATVNGVAAPAASPLMLAPTLNRLIAERRASEYADIEERKRRVRAATRTMLMVVFTYLLANVLNVVLTFWEYVDMESLTGDYMAFYTFGVDTVSILTILAGGLRPPIYLACMPQLRREFAALANRFKPSQKAYIRPILHSLVRWFLSRVKVQRARQPGGGWSYSASKMSSKQPTAATLTTASNSSVSVSVSTVAQDVTVTANEVDPNINADSFLIVKR